MLLFDNEIYSKLLLLMSLSIFELLFELFMQSEGITFRLFRLKSYVLLQMSSMTELIHQLQR